MAKQKGIIIAVLAAIALIFTVACGKQETEPAEADTLASVEETVDTEDTAETAETQETQEEEAAEASAEEKVVLSGDYLAEIEEGGMLEFAYSDYNPDYQVGDRITLSVTMESASGINGCCVGSSYDWKQEEFAYEAGSCTLTWTVTPSLDNAQLNIWWAIW